LRLIGADIVGENAGLIDPAFEKSKEIAKMIE